MRYSVNWTEEKKARAIEILTKYFGKHGPGECIMQSDDSLIEAPDVLSEIADSVLVEGEGLVYNNNED